MMGNKLALCVLALWTLVSCSTPTRRPAPSTVVPAENAQQLSPSTPQPEKTSSAGESNSEQGEKVQTIDDSYKQNQASYHYSMGQAFALDGDSERAVEEYKLALIYDPNSAVIHTRLASEYVKRGMLTFAIESCKRSVELDAKYLDARLLLAGLYASTKLVKEALEQYDKILKIDATNTEAYVFKGSLLLEEDRPVEAVKVLQTLVAKDPDAFLGFYYLARAYQKQAKADLAIANYKKALEARPSFSQAGLSLGLLLEEKGRQKEAIKVYETLYEEAGDMQAVARLAQIYIDKDNFEAALRYLLIIANGDEDNLNVQVKIGLIYIEKKRYDEAAAAFKKILGHHPDADRVRFYLGAVYEEQKRYEDAIEEFKKIHPEASLYVDAVVHIGQLYKALGNVEKGLEWAEKAILEKPDAAQFVVFKAALLDELKRTADAVLFLEKSQEKFGGDERVLYYLGSLYDKLGKQDRALEVMVRIIERNPDHAHALNYVGYTYAARSEKLDEAEKMIQRAMELKPDDGYIIDSYGYILMARGQLRKATIELERAAKMRPDEAVILEHLGDVYLRGNLKQKALQKYRDAEKLYADPQEKEKIAKKIVELERALGLSPTQKPRTPAGD